MWFIGVEVEQETSAPPPKKNPILSSKIKVKSKKWVQSVLTLFQDNIMS